MFHRNAVGLVRGVNIITFVYKLSQTRFTVWRINYFFLENTTGKFLEISLYISSQFYIFILPEGIRKPYGFLTFSEGVEMQHWEQNYLHNKQNFYKKIDLEVYFDILMFFSSIQDRWNSYLYVTENFNIQEFFDLRKLINIQLTLWKSKFSIIFNQCFSVYERHKKGGKKR